MMRKLSVAAMAGLLLSLAAGSSLRCQTETAAEKQVARGATGSTGTPNATTTAPKPASQLLTQILKQIQGAQAIETVPPLEGMTQSQASAALDKHDLRGTFPNVEGHDSGHVAAQSPVSGSRVKAGTNIAVTMGPMVPTLLGLTANVATMKLKDASLQLGGQTTEGGASVVPLIARQIPEAGTYVLPNSGVAVWLPPQAMAGKSDNGGATDSTEAAGDGYTSTTGRWFKMPDVLSLTYKQAESVLASVGVLPVASQGRTSGSVQEQSVTAGSPVQKGEHVTLTMGIVVPDVEGLTPADAQQQLAKAGLRGLYSASVSSVPGMSLTVVEQTPASSSVATTNLNVMLFAKLSPGWPWWLGGAGVLLLAGWSIGKIVKAFFPHVPAEFRAKVSREAKPLSVRVAPKVEFELRAKRGDGALKVLRAAQVKSTVKEASDDRGA
jgi:beta-lactam-binding protein with PASTA domain